MRDTTIQNRWTFDAMAPVGGRAWRSSPEFSDVRHMTELGAAMEKGASQDFANVSLYAETVAFAVARTDQEPMGTSAALAVRTTQTCEIGEVSFGRGRRLVLLALAMIARIISCGRQ